MNYDLSVKIRAEIEKSQKILINAHRSPDVDSVGSALSLYEVIKAIGKDATVICPNALGKDVSFLPHSEVVKKINFAGFNFSDYDIFIVLDSGNLAMVTGQRDIKIEGIKVIAIDHHVTNDKFGLINLIDEKASSTAELLYRVFEDWGVKLNRDIAQNLLAGILGDTGVFHYHGVDYKRTLGIAQKLMELGADKDEIILKVFHSYPFNKIKFWGEIIRMMKYEAEYKFVWSAVSHEVYMKFKEPLSAKESAASIFATSAQDSDFGIIMVEEDPKILSISLRSRGANFDVSKIAERLGGGGHLAAAGAKVYGMDFDSAVEKVLSAAREVVNETNKG